MLALKHESAEASGRHLAQHFQRLVLDCSVLESYVLIVLPEKTS